MGGLAIRKASEVAVPAYLSSVCATSKGVEAMIPNTIFEETNPFLESAQQRWLDMAGPDVLLPENTSSQKEWNLPLCKTRYDRLLASATTDKERARLLAVAEKILRTGYKPSQFQVWV